MIPIIDTHQHLWDLDTLSVSWVKGDKLMDRSYRMPDYLEAASGTGIERTVYMEVNVDPDYLDQEVDQMTQHCLSPETPMQAMVIAIDPLASDFEEALSRYAANVFVRGARTVLHTPGTGPKHCQKTPFVSGIQELGKRGWLFDICIRPAELADTLELVRSCPQTTFVIDHCGNADPHIVNGDVDPGGESDGTPYWHTASGWKDDMAALAMLPNTVCKLSGIVARARPGWSAETLAPTLNHCLEVFGEERVIFGGDWPVCLTGAPLVQWVQAFRTVLGQRSVTFQEQAMFANAERIYTLGAR